MNGKPNLNRDESLFGYSDCLFGWEQQFVIWLPGHCSTLVMQQVSDERESFTAAGESAAFNI